MTEPRIKIQPVGMFHTPENWDELFKWIELHNPDDRPHLLTAAIMAWNLAAKLTNTEDEK